MPGYSAQNATFAFMIGFLVVIVAIILAIFMYVLTIQKAPVFGVMKAQGLSNQTSTSSALSQNFVLSFIGSCLGFLLTVLSSLLLPQVVPFVGNGLFYMVIFVGLIVFVLLGSLFSVLVIRKIDPLDAIG